MTLQKYKSRCKLLRICEGQEGEAVRTARLSGSVRVRVHRADGHGGGALSMRGHAFAATQKTACLGLFKIGVMEKLASPYRGS